MGREQGSSDPSRSIHSNTNCNDTANRNRVASAPPWTSCQSVGNDIVPTTAHTTKQHMTKTTWATNMLDILWTDYFKLWEARNKFVHGKTMIEKQERKQAEIEQKITKLYEKKKTSICQQNGEYWGTMWRNSSRQKDTQPWQIGRECGDQCLRRAR